MIWNVKNLQLQALTVHCGLMTRSQICVSTHENGTDFIWCVLCAVQTALKETSVTATKEIQNTKIWFGPLPGVWPQTLNNMSGSRWSSTNVSGHSLIVLRGLLQGCPGILRELSRLCSSPANAFPLGVVNVPEIIQRAGLPNLRSTRTKFLLFLKTERNQTDPHCNYTLKNTPMPEPSVYYVGWQAILDVRRQTCSYDVHQNYAVAEEHVMRWDLKQIPSVCSNIVTQTSN